MLNLKTLTIAGAMLVAMIGGASAATLDYNTKVLDAPNKWANVLQWGWAGENVNVQYCGAKYCFVHISGPDGFVKKSAIDFGYPSYPVYPTYPSYPSYPTGCIYGPYGYVCI